MESQVHYGLLKWPPQHTNILTKELSISHCIFLINEDSFVGAQCDKEGTWIPKMACPSS